MKEITRYIFIGVFSSLLTLSLFLGISALADGDPATDGVPKYIPYQGTLEKNGAGINATVEMTFALYDGASASEPEWTETLQVPVYGGRFSALLGSSSGSSVVNLTSTVRDADDLHLAVSIQDGDQLVPLSNRQRFVPLPYALWSTSATDFQVAGTVLGGLRVNGANLAPIEGVEGEFSHVLKLQNGGQAMFMDGNEIVSNGTLYLQDDSPHGVEIGVSGFASENIRGLTVYGGDVELADGSTTEYVGCLKVAGAGGNMWMDGNEINSNAKLYINNETQTDVELGANLYVGGAIDGENIDCRSAGCGMISHNLQGGPNFGQWYDWSNCEEGTYMCGMRQKAEPDCGSDCDDTGVDDIEIRCCPF